MIAVLYARMFVLHGFDPSRMLSAQMQTAQMQHAQMQHAQMQHAQMQHAQMQYAQMQAIHMQPAQMQASHMQSAPMQPSHMQTAQVQAAQMPPARLQAGQLYGLNPVPSSQSATNANSSLNPLLPGPGKLTGSVALHKKVDHEFQFGWKFDTRDWRNKPDPMQRNLYGFTREEYLFIKEQKLLNTNPFYMQWEIDRREESDRLKALRPWYRNEGTDDSDLVLMSDAVLSKELEAFYGGMEKGKISNVTVPDPNNGNAVDVASNLSRTNGQNALNSFIDEAHVGSDASELPSKFSMKAGLRGRLIDSGVCVDGGLKIPFQKTANSFNLCSEEIGLYRAPGDEDESTSVDHAPYDLEGFTSDRYHDTACDLQLGPWQASIGELTEKFLPKTPDCPPEQPSATSPVELIQLATGKSSDTPSAEVVVRKASLIGRPTSVTWSASPPNSPSSSESSLPSSPDIPTPQGNTLWDKHVVNAGLAPYIGLHYQMKLNPPPGDARYALLEQTGKASYSRLDHWAFANRYRILSTAQKRHANDEDAANDNSIKVEDAETGWSSHMPLKKKAKKFGEMGSCPV